MPAELRDGPSGPDFAALPFTPLYLTESEFAAEIANRTMHGVMHIGRVPDGTGGYRAQLAVLVKPNGRFGTAYMAAIRPFRHLIVYPAVMRDAAGLAGDPGVEASPPPEPSDDVAHDGLGRRRPKGEAPTWRPQSPR